MKNVKEKSMEAGEEAGDMKAMREALVSVKKSIDGIGASSLDCDPEIIMMSLTQLCAGLSARIDAALAKPPRNCDVGTAEEQEERYLRLKKEHIDRLTRCPHVGCAAFFPDSLYWAQMPYKEGGTDGSM